MAITSDILRSKFGFNDQNVINGILNDPNQVARYEREMGGGSSGGGGNNVSLDVPSIADYTEKAYAPADEALKSYVMALRGQKNPLDVYNELEQAAGLPEAKKTAGTLREQIGSLEDTIKRVEGNVSATTRESLVTEGQRAGMVEARQRPLLQDLGTLTTGLGRIEQGITAATQGLDTKTNLFLKGQEQQMKPFEVQVTAMQDRAARAVSGFTADTQNKLTTLMAQWNRNNELSDKQVDQAFELLKIEKNYNNEIAKITEQSKTNIAEYKAKKGIDNTSTTPVNTSKYYGGAGTYYNNGGGGISDLWNALG